MVRRSRVQAIALCACAVGAVIFILSQIFGGSERIPSGTPPVVIVTVLNPELYTKEYLNNIKDNRIARITGYQDNYITPRSLVAPRGPAEN